MTTFSEIISLIPSEGTANVISDSESLELAIGGLLFSLWVDNLETDKGDIANIMVDTYNSMCNNNCHWSFIKESLNEIWHYEE